MEKEKQLHSKLLKFTQTGKIGLATDIDGTISFISDDPSRASITLECKRNLLELLNSGRLAVVAVISERSALESRKLVDIGELLYLGNYGLEILEPGQNEVTLSKAVRPYQALVSSVLETVQYKLVHYPGELFEYHQEPDWREKLIFENKGATAAIHYRQVANPREVRQVLLKVAGEVAGRAGLRLSEGRKVIELRPPVEINKGTAIFDLVERYQLNRLIYLGDDLSDQPAFKMLHELEQPNRLGFNPSSSSSGFEGLAVAVASPEMPHVLGISADYLADGVSGAEQFLTTLLEVVRQPRSGGVHADPSSNSCASYFQEQASARG